MKTSTKAVWLSALVFPGLGHWLLQRYLMAVVLVAAVAIALYYLVMQAVERALAISEKIQTGEVPLDIEIISRLVTDSTAGADSHIASVATTVVIVAWLVGVIDCYRLGRVQSG